MVPVVPLPPAPGDLAQAGGAHGAGAAVWEVSAGQFLGAAPAPHRGGFPQSRWAGTPGRHLSGAGVHLLGGLPSAQGGTAVHERSPQGACPVAVPGAPGAAPSVHSLPRSGLAASACPGRPRWRPGTQSPGGGWGVLRCGPQT